MQDGAAKCGAKSVAMERRLGNSCGVEEELVGIPSRSLVVFICLAMKLVGPGPGSHSDVRAAIGPLRSVIHRSVHVNFFDGLRRGRGQTLANGVENGSIGLDHAACLQLLVGIEDEAALSDGAGG